MANKYIAYLDFVGTKGIAFISDAFYTSNITKIKDILVELSTEYTSIKTTMLSDSVFISSNDKKIFDFLHELRNSLFYENIFFTCVVMNGKFGLDISKSKNFDYYIFKEAATIKVYAQQAVLKGISIDIINIVEDGKKKKNNKFDYMESYYLCSNGLVKVCDLAYKNPITTNTDNILEYYKIKLDTIFKAAYQQSLINSNAAKYYLTPFISILKSAICNNEENVRKQLLEYTLNLFNKAYIKENNILLFMFAFLIDCILNFNDITNEDIEFTLGIKSNNFFMSLMKQLNIIPTELLSALNKKELLDIYYKVS